MSPQRAAAVAVLHMSEWSDRLGAKTAEGEIEGSFNKNT